MNDTDLAIAQSKLSGKCIECQVSDTVKRAGSMRRGPLRTWQDKALPVDYFCAACYIRLYHK